MGDKECVQEVRFQLRLLLRGSWELVASPWSPSQPLSCSPRDECGARSEPRVTQGVTSAGAPQRVAPRVWRRADTCSRCCVTAARLVAAAHVPLPCHRDLSQPHTPFPALEDSRVGLGVPVLLRVTLQAGPVTASMGGFAALPSLGKMVYLCSPDPPCPPKPRAGQQALSPVSCRVALQIDRVGTALQLPVPPYLGPAMLSWGSMAAGGAVALEGLLWHLGPPLPLWGTRPQGRAALEC